MELGYYLQLRHAGILKKLPTQDRSAHELNIIRSYGKQVRNREHGGDSHQHFSELDLSNDDHLDTDELLGLLGPNTVSRSHSSGHLALWATLADTSQTGLLPVGLNFASAQKSTSLEVHRVRQCMARSVADAMDEDQNGRVHRSEFIAAMHSEF